MGYNSYSQREVDDIEDLEDRRILRFTRTLCQEPLEETSSISPWVSCGTDWISGEGYNQAIIHISNRFILYFEIRASASNVAAAVTAGMEVDDDIYINTDNGYGEWTAKVKSIHASDGKIICERYVEEGVTKLGDSWLSNYLGVATFGLTTGAATWTITGGNNEGNSLGLSAWKSSPGDHMIISGLPLTTNWLTTSAQNRRYFPWIGSASAHPNGQLPVEVSSSSVVGTTTENGYLNIVPAKFRILPMISMNLAYCDYFIELIKTNGGK